MLKDKIAMHMEQIEVRTRYPLDFLHHALKLTNLKSFSKTHFQLNKIHK